MVERDDEWQSEEELEAHYGPSGPVAAAVDFLALIAERDLRAAWPKIDPNLRLCLTQAWLYANRSHPVVANYDGEQVAGALADLSFDHELWLPFEETQLRELREWMGDFHPSTWGAASRPRPIGADTELVKFFPTGGEVLLIETPTLLENGLALLMRRTPDGWLFAATSAVEPTPGWPPDVPRPSIV
jgi:hypothetical protein